MQVVALTRGGPLLHDLKQANIPVTVLGKRLRFDPFAWWRLRRIIRQFQPDIIHTWLFAGNAYGRLAAGAAPTARVIVSERCVDSWKSGWQLAVDRRLIPRTSRLVGNSQSVANFYQQQGFPADKIRVIPNGMAVTPIEPVDRQEFLRSLDLPEETRLIGYVGRLARQKRVDVLIWSIELLRSLAANTCLIVIGDGPERDSLEDAARRFGISDHVRFLGHRDDAARIVPLFEVCCLASTFEGMSNSLMEAMAAGIPVVASDIPPNRELVIDGQTGFLTKIEDSVGISQYCERILADPELASRLGAAGKQRIIDEFSPTGMINAYAALYREVHAENPDGSAAEAGV